MPTMHPKENPRTTRVRDAVTDVVIRLLVEEGAGAITASRVAEEAKVARSTIYQHWSSTNELLLHAIDRLISPHGETPITGDLESDLVSALTLMRERMVKRPFRQVFSTLLDQANYYEEFEAAQVRFVTGSLAQIRAPLEAAIRRGELPSTLDVDMAILQLAGPLFVQHIMLRTTISNELIARTSARFLEEHRLCRGQVDSTE